MRPIFSDQAWEDYIYWESQDRKTLKRINTLISETKRTPFEGTGKPEPLKGNLSGYWSRHIDKKHRMVYRVVNGDLEIAQLRYHYEP